MRTWAISVCGVRSAPADSTPSRRELYPAEIQWIDRLMAKARRRAGGR